MKNLFGCYFVSLFYVLGALAILQILFFFFSTSLKKSVFQVMKNLMKERIQFMVITKKKIVFKLQVLLESHV